MTTLCIYLSISAKVLHSDFSSFCLYISLLVLFFLKSVKNISCSLWTVISCFLWLSSLCWPNYILPLHHFKATLPAAGISPNGNNSKIYFTHSLLRVIFYQKLQVGTIGYWMYTPHLLYLFLNKILSFIIFIFKIIFRCLWLAWILFCAFYFIFS